MMQVEIMHDLKDDRATGHPRADGLDATIWLP
jgi:hypothetical protein